MKYKSIFSPGKEVEAAQYITELVCKYRADSCAYELSDQFWKEKIWQQFFVRQIMIVHKLRKIYSDEAIISTINRCKVQTLYPEWVLREIKKYKAPEKPTFTVKENPTFEKTVESKDISYLD